MFDNIHYCFFKVDVREPTNVHHWGCYVFDVLSLYRYSFKWIIDNIGNRTIPKTDNESTQFITSTKQNKNQNVMDVVKTMKILIN